MWSLAASLKLDDVIRVFLGLLGIRSWKSVTTMQIADMKFLIPIVSALALSSCGLFSGGKKDAGASSGGQSEWALGMIDRKHRKGKVVILDKKSATLTAYNHSKSEFSFPVLLGKARKDDFNKKISAFSQGVTPSIYYKTPRIMHNPKFSSIYKEKTVIAYDDLTKVGNKTEVLSFHTTIEGGNDANIADGRPGNNRLSNGCIRVRHSDYLKLLSFMLPSGNLKELKEVQKKGEPKDMISPAAVVILPEVDPSYEGTRKALR